MLRELGVNFERTESLKRGIALEAAAELVEDGGGERDFGCAVEVHDGLEGAFLA